MIKLGLIWDIDGVVVDSPHEVAWRETVTKEPWNAEGMTSEFYFKHVASRPRYEGGDNILRLLGVYDRLGARTEEERSRLLDRFCTEKNEMIRDLISRGEFKLFPDAVELLLKAKSMALPCAAASASKNASTMLQKVDKNRVVDEVGDDLGLMDGTLLDLFDVNACGLDLSGKEAIQYKASMDLKDLYPTITHFMVFEDAPSGIRAAKNLGYYAVGVYRIGSIAELQEAGADIVVDDLRKIDLREMVKALAEEGWYEL